MLKEYTVIKDGVIQDEKVCITQVLEAMQASGIRIVAEIDKNHPRIVVNGVCTSLGIVVDDIDKLTHVLNGGPIMVDGVCTSFLSQIMMQQRWRALQTNDLSTDELARSPWLLNQ